MIHFPGHGLQLEGVLHVGFPSIVDRDDVQGDGPLALELSRVISDVRAMALLQRAVIGVPWLPDCDIRRLVGRPPAYPVAVLLDQARQEAERGRMAGKLPKL